jgi:hypothetical protein
LKLAQRKRRLLIGRHGGPRASVGEKKSSKQGRELILENMAQGNNIFIFFSNRTLI